MRPSDGGALSPLCRLHQPARSRTWLRPARHASRARLDARRRSGAGTPLRATGGRHVARPGARPARPARPRRAATVSGSTAPSTQVLARPILADACRSESAGQLVQRQAGRRPEPQLVGRPAAWPSAAGASSATSRPPSTMATRSASCSASSMKWVVSSTVDAVALERSDDLPGGPPRLRVHAGGRLVQEDQLRPADQRQRQRQPLLLAAGERPVARARRRPPGRPARAARADRSGGRRSWRTAPALRAAASTARRRRPGASRRSWA